MKAFILFALIATAAANPIISVNNLKALTGGLLNGGLLNGGLLNGGLLNGGLLNGIGLGGIGLGGSGLDGLGGLLSTGINLIIGNGGTAIPPSTGGVITVPGTVVVDDGGLTGGTILPDGTISTGGIILPDGTITTGGTTIVGGETIPILSGGTTGIIGGETITQAISGPLRYSFLAPEQHHAVIAEEQRYIYPQHIPSNFVYAPTHSIESYPSNLPPATLVETHRVAPVYQHAAPIVEHAVPARYAETVFVGGSHSRILEKPHSTGSHTIIEGPSGKIVHSDNIVSPVKEIRTGSW